MAEVHIIGSLHGATGFPRSELCCKWSLVSGDAWRLVEGEETGQTHVDLPAVGWPKFHVEVFHQDMFGRNELYGYGFVHVPTTPGVHQLDCVTWRPAGSLLDQLWAFFLGATPQLRDPTLVHTATDRFRLTTVAMGKVHLEVGVVLRGFDGYGVAN
ncbi:B9 domain-containing protein 2 [Blyttiomyces helicus]|uniref:B9 domain-containing protein 2 n=1 Tax=Blyttiomyces helicus TaxID=388810 RepID=A0A4P9WFM9_9FUNG|nr:B9 domain-containing protein 2 [Blyttiomyces helicus]|eukprot:RKO91569.1 B9 domain-containing protein 2 [Blyttiomyces helicus]